MNPVDEIKEIKEEITTKDKSRFLTFLLFLVISAVLWFMIKLTKEYSTQSVFLVHYTEVPANKWVSTPDQQVKVTFVADGFVTLGHNLVRQARRTVDIPLDEVPYRLEGGFTYSYSSQYVVERVAEWLGIPAGSVSINDDKQYFNMEDLQSKELEVTVPLQLTLQRQFQVYGTPQVEPPKVTVYGPKNMLDTLTVIATEPLHANDVGEDIQRALPLNLFGGAVRCETREVQVTVDVERFTERDIEVPVTLPDTLSLRFFPETMSVKCMVAIKDYGSITPANFVVEADTAQLRQLQPLLDIRLVSVPDQVQILKTSPDRVEYLILN